MDVCFSIHVGFRSLELVLRTPICAGINAYDEDQITQLSFLDRAFFLV
jgi:hypothetical protein